MDLTVETRQKFGKQAASLRRVGFVPAELYGNGIENLHLSIPIKDFKKVFKEAGMNTIINLSFGKDLHAGKQESRPAIVHDIATDSLTGEIIHVDFYQVRMDEKIKAKVPVEFLGIAPAVKDKGGILNKSVYEIEVEALPADLPHRFEVDLSLLDELNKSIYVGDIKISKGVKILIDDSTPVATVTEPRAEEVVEVAPVDVSTVKVETEEKKAERDAGKDEMAKGEKK